MNTHTHTRKLNITSHYRNDGETVAKLVDTKKWGRVWVS